MQNEIRYELNQIHTIMPLVWQRIKNEKIITLNGSLGAGKTTFTSALCLYLQVHEKVSSPTFSLINEYTYQDQTGEEKIIYHSDWYRIQNEEEAINAGIEEMLNQKHALCIIEWPKKASDLLPQQTLNIHFTVENETTRTLRFEYSNLADE